MANRHKGLSRRGMITAAMAAGVFGLTGCGIQEGAKKIAKIILNPSTPVGEPGEQPSRLVLSTLGNRNMNPNIDGQSTPLSVIVFALKSDHLLYEYDFASLLIDPETTLGPTLIEVIDEVQIVPDEFKVIRDYEVPEGTRNIGFAALFTSYEGAVWRVSVPVTDTGMTENILLSVSGSRISAAKEG